MHTKQLFVSGPAESETAAIVQWGIASRGIRTLRKFHFELVLKDAKNYTADDPYLRTRISFLKRPLITTFPTGHQDLHALCP